MNPVTVNQESCAIVYDADVLPAANAALFSVDYWQEQGALEGSATGRGTSWFIRSDFGEVVLRRYLRGGWMSKVNHDRYWFNSIEQSRPFKEFDVLRRMSGDGLRVPVPVGALCERAGLAYRAALITRRITPARPLPECFSDPSLDWAAVGGGLREFHDAGMDHADLNARNILIHDETGEVWVLDLDASTYSPGTAVPGADNLARLRRSLKKLWPKSDAPGVDAATAADGMGSAAPKLEDCWAALLHGYGR